MHNDNLTFRSIHVKDPMATLSHSYQTMTFCTKNGQVYSTGCGRHGAMGTGPAVDDLDNGADETGHLTSGGFCYSCFKAKWKKVPSITGPVQTATGGFHTLYLVRDPLHLV